MITVRPPRKRSGYRRPSDTNKTPTARTVTLTSPMRGLVTNQNIAQQDGASAIVLENFWPTPTGVRLRGGTEARVSIPNAVTALFEYRTDIDVSFVADEENIYEFSSTTISGTVLDPTVTGQTGGSYSTVQMQTDGGSYLIAVNGSDPMQIYDGISWQQIGPATAPFAVTGVDTENLSHVWIYRNRVFFIEKNSADVWYLSTNSVAGEATRFPLSGVFQLGGTLMTGATWSSDSGAGMDDRCVFVTDQGEFAVYAGGDPGDASNWALEGVYNIGKPLGSKAMMSVGGDLIFATEAGLIPISAARTKDVGALKLDSLSYNIEPDWSNAVAFSGYSQPWIVEKWAERNMALVSPFRDRREVFAVNLESGAWTKFTGWRVRAMGVLGDVLHYGDDKGQIYRCETGGLDGNNPIVARLCYAFEHMANAGSYKSIGALRGTFRHLSRFKPRFSIATDYRPIFPAAPSAALTNEAGNIWDEATWNADFWGAATVSAANDDGNDWGQTNWDADFWGSKELSAEITAHWQGVSGMGYTLAPQLQITSATTNRLLVEFISVDLSITDGLSVG